MCTVLQAYTIHDEEMSMMNPFTHEMRYNNVRTPKLPFAVALLSHRLCTMLRTRATSGVVTDKRLLLML